MPETNSERAIPLLSRGSGGYAGSGDGVQWYAIRYAGLLVVLVAVFGVSMFVADIYTVQSLRPTPKLSSWREALQKKVCASTLAKVASSEDFDESKPPEVTIVITCGTQETGTISEMEPLIKSVIAMTSKPLRFVFFTDASGVTRLQEMFTKNLTRTKRRL